jgi:hypothetical protein
MTRPIDHSPDWTVQLIADLGYFSTVFVRLLLAYSEEPQSNPKTEDNLLLAVGMLEAASSSLGVKNPFRVPTGPTEARKFFNNSLSDLRDLGDQLTGNQFLLLGPHAHPLPVNLLGQPRVLLSRSHFYPVPLPRPTPTTRLHSIQSP